ncbi:hypothetical protein FOA43_002802 [Brettanomyces nanus]|uniref:Uncharacterized protein n=1 Tax=Eeniella nana TaxID=13502 RepID=A0A875RVD6_EENNA|nr:uncharacterized protein FOA43_002802 [Brettanomyces nanus]QPG75447.1 hypothetical protein FOA43_002802 [Brettanomyces nanus]
MDAEEDALHFIVDPSALVYGGIGRIKEWVKNDKYYPPIVYYIPHYTLLELDFLKKTFNPLIAKNARESIRFFDSSISGFELPESSEFTEPSDSLVANESSDDDMSSPSSSSSDLLDDISDISDFESYNKRKEDLLTEHSAKEGVIHKPKQPKSQFILEPPEAAGPGWKKTSEYRMRTPLCSEFATGSGSARETVGVFGNRLLFANIKKGGVDNYRSKESGYADNGEEKAIIPKRLKLLIRSAIQKQFIDRKKNSSVKDINWTVLCEDETTCTWLKCFGLPMMTLNEADSKLNEWKQKTTSPHASTSKSSSSFRYVPPHRVKESLNSTRHLCEDGVYRENFKETKYAPRGRGELWKP